MFAQGKSTTTTTSTTSTTSSSGKSSTSGGSTVGSLSPTAAQAVDGVQFNSFGGPQPTTESTAPWDTRTPVKQPPWARPPPQSN